ncbi:hypothetical protein HMPREF9154_3132 [Arachnia propionica F0230a]|nr:hypothetical protein HMPREF9154_3132 [Arachnia propionica F0230a]
MDIPHQPRRRASGMRTTHHDGTHAEAPHICARPTPPPKGRTSVRRAAALVMIPPGSFLFDPP